MKLHVCTETKAITRQLYDIKIKSDLRMYDKNTQDRVSQISSIYNIA
jgi:hypothetical protein